MCSPPALRLSSQGNVLGEGPVGCGSGCSNPGLGTSVIPVNSCPSSPQSDQEDQGPEDQGYPSVPSVAFSPLVESDNGDTGGATHDTFLLQVHLEDP